MEKDIAICIVSAIAVLPYILLIAILSIPFWIIFGIIYTIKIIMEIRKGDSND